MRKKSVWATMIAAFIAIFWTIPTLGLFITSFRPQIDAIQLRLVDGLAGPERSPSRTTRRR